MITSAKDYDLLVQVQGYKIRNIKGPHQERIWLNYQSFWMNSWNKYITGVL